MRQYVNGAIKFDAQPGAVHRSREACSHPQSARPFDWSVACFISVSSSAYGIGFLVAFGLYLVLVNLSLSTNPMAILQCNCTAEGRSIDDIEVLTCPEFFGAAQLATFRSEVGLAPGACSAGGISHEFPE